VERILERYERHSYAERQEGAGDQAPNVRLQFPLNQLLTVIFILL